MIYTSYYSRAHALQEAGIVPISISRGKPKWFSGEAIDSLAPRWDMLKMPTAQYNAEYQKILKRNNPHEIVDRIVRGRDVALLCYEKDINDCHRKMVGEWLRENGYECEEWEPQRKEPQKKAAMTAFQALQMSLF